MITLKYSIWNIKTQPVDEIKRIAGECGCSEFLARLLYNRSFLTKEDIDSFLNDDLSTLSDPFLLTDMQKATERIKEAIESDQKISVYGDYDVDGITSVCILTLYLKSIGANVDYYIPSRLGEGYGVNTNAVIKLATKKTKLIITVDCGITADKEAGIMRSLGIDLIVTDHHKCKETLPNARAVINPKRPNETYPFCDFAGVGVAFKLICALNMSIRNMDKVSAAADALKRFSDLTAIGTIADVMPMRSENRTIVKYGLSHIEKTNNPGLCAFLDKVDAKGKEQGAKLRKINSSFIGYVMAPRINAAGRIGDANRAAELFLCNDKETGVQIANELDMLNRERQQLEGDIFCQAEKIITENDLTKNSALVVAGRNWNSGIIGIVASKLCEKYRKPTVMITFEGDDNVGKGSGRSVDSIDLCTALESSKDHLIQFGGHKLAAGLTIESDKIDAFSKSLCEYVSANSKGDAPSRFDCDFELGLEDLTISNILDMQKLEPFGTDNAQPSFAVSDLEILSMTGVGSNKHIKLMCRKSGVELPVMCFGVSPSDFDYHEGQKIDILCRMEINSYKGTESIQISALDIRAAQNVNNAAQKILQAIKQKEFDKIKGAPNKDDFARLYRYVAGSAKNTFYIEDLAKVQSFGTAGEVIILEVLSELGIWEYAFGNDSTVKIEKINKGIRANLADSSILQALGAVID